MFSLFRPRYIKAKPICLERRTNKTVNLKPNKSPLKTNAPLVQVRRIKYVWLPRFVKFNASLDTNGTVITLQ